MSSSHKAGSDSGIDRGVVIIFLLWVAITIVLAVTFVLEARGQSLRPVAGNERNTQFEAALTTPDGDRNAH